MDSIGDPRSPGASANPPPQGEREPAWHRSRRSITHRLPSARIIMARFKPGDRIGRRDRARAELGAVHVGVAGVAAGAAGHRVEARVVAGVAHVVDQRPGAVERGRAEIVLVPGHHVAGGMADAAADAFDAGVGGLPLRRRWRHHMEVAPAPRPARNAPCASRHLSKKPVISTARSLTTVKLRSGSSRKRAVVADRLADPRAAGPARAAVHHHGAGAAHADPAGEAVRQGRVLLALDLGHHVEHGLVRAARHAARPGSGPPARRARPRPRASISADSVQLMTEC